MEVIKRSTHATWEMKIERWHQGLEKWQTRIVVEEARDLFKILCCGIDWKSCKHRILINTHWCKLVTKREIEFIKNNF